MTAAGKARGIIFRGDMVRAILDGRKTQTRRLVTLREFDRSGTPGYDWTFRDREARWHDFRNADFLARKCPYGVPGDRLWVRETWHDSPDGTIYRATKEQHGSCDFGGDAPWRPSIFMPRSKSRLTLVVESVRVERLSEISGEDVIAEGFDLPLGVDESHVARDRGNVSTGLRFDFVNAFRAMHERRGKRASKSKREPQTIDADPWLWVVTFRKETSNG